MNENDDDVNKNDDDVAWIELSERAFTTIIRYIVLRAADRYRARLRDHVHDGSDDHNTGLPARAASEDEDRPMTKRKHGIGAATGGEVGSVPGGEIIGPCPSCGAKIEVTHAPDPRSGRVERALMHPFPFCSYFGHTDSAEIERAIIKGRA